MFKDIDDFTNRFLIRLNVKHAMLTLYMKNKEHRHRAKLVTGQDSFLETDTRENGEVEHVYHVKMTKRNLAVVCS